MAPSPPSENMTHMDMQSWAMVTGLSVLWGGSFFFVEIAIRDLPPFTVVLGRLVLASLTLWLCLRVFNLPVPKGVRAWLLFAFLGLINNAIPFSLFVWAQTHITSGLASILNATTPLFAVVLAHFVNAGEPLKMHRLIGVLIGVFGVSVMIGVDVLSDLGASVWAQFACLGAALAYAISGIVGKRAQSLRLHPISIATGQLTCACIWIAPLVVVVDRPWTLPMPHISTVFALVGLATLSTALAYFIYFKVLSRTSATNLLLVTFLLPISAILLGMVFLGERLSVEQWAGMGIIAISLMLIDGRPAQRVLQKSWSNKADRA